MGLKLNNEKYSNYTLFIISNTYGNQEKIEIRNFGIICIGSGYDYIVKKNW